ncbi:glycosyl transferase family 90 [uncultured Duncaniella sp.]|uniref:glycosyl transferase family 90 n=1 Tax=uncultured Duncaniella sp. TaxID=2768039 RepID=UPI0025E9ACC0|nr:glycosyl transferase family 90 [uncultured Duncaniella sp.]
MRIRTDFRSLIKGYQRISFFTGNFSRYFMPDVLFRAIYRFDVKRLSSKELEAIDRRVDYYARCGEGAKIDESEAVRVGDFHFPWKAKHKLTTYFFDLYECVRCFPDRCRFTYKFGDVDWDFPTVTFAKARPITNGKSNTVLMPLNKVRHFRFITDTRRFRDKKDMMIFRNVVRCQPQRSLMLEKYIDHPMCDIGQINKDAADPRFIKPYVPMEEQLDYKFIASIEGHDVATNLKWVMSSNSVAVMPRPRIESWFMEGKLIPDYHYIEIKPDYSDLIEKLEYYIAHPEKAEAIIEHAHAYVDEFRDRERELLIARLTAARYFRLTGQLH